ncbi:peptidoglycan DD-metalloendopeptidase family protein [Pseudomonas sp. 5P_3.1_Bac2]|uniref:peptidoglycan DD-metalloendopeptidase family protein n=1 Tax=Pseudomonas sp. 5P_3.1_Bac2 TaxID=2971617 RepID=UPI0021C5E664|nr:peptidoglycan DD-metalloendopeptidase family protein [Pseudomonas sp. 5P_3.1_Bac2]MCU1715844.1 peptidoglycan DD-metalloendopeptidase family protein [Pseudomonas sp. 5P_3.1_Bac2]
MSFTAIHLPIRASKARCLLSGLILCVLLNGCTSSPAGGVKVVDRTGASKSQVQKRQPVTSGQYRVARGDTLYSIAFRFGWDWKALAVRNNIAPPYVIKVGQLIRFDGQQTNRSTVVAAAPSQTPNSSSTKVSSKQVVTAVPTQAKPAQPITALPASQRSSSGWIWPTNGQVIGVFSSNGSLNKGIDIAGELGQPVLAASDGAVVYAGSGLRGYGELVIIKHSDTYVSAYGHNRRLLVQEGQKVKAGQRIAEMGSTGTDRVKLHFEVRRQGKPVDPLQYLPRR